MFNLQLITFAMFLTGVMLVVLGHSSLKVYKGTAYSYYAIGFLIMGLANNVRAFSKYYENIKSLELVLAVAFYGMAILYWHRYKKLRNDDE